MKGTDGDGREASASTVRQPPGRPGGEATRETPGGRLLLISLGSAGLLSLLGLLNITPRPADGVAIYAMSLALIIIVRSISRPFRWIPRGGARPASPWLRSGYFAAVFGSAMGMLTLLGPLGHGHPGAVGALSLGLSLTLESVGVMSMRPALRSPESEEPPTWPLRLHTAAVAGSVTGLCGAFLGGSSLFGGPPRALTSMGLLVVWAGAMLYCLAIDRVGSTRALRG